MKQKVIIQKPAKTAMSSGRAKTKKWVMTFIPDSPQQPDCLMGWQSGQDTRRQIRLEFATKDAAIAYAKVKGHDYQVISTKQRTVKSKSYAANFTKPLVG